jgi:hypothetical protein
VPPQPLLLDRLVRRNRRQVRYRLAMAIIIAALWFIAIHAFHLSPYWWIAPALIGLVILGRVFDKLAAIRHPENDPFFRTHVLPHGSLETVARELDRDLSDPTLHRRFSLLRGTLTFTEHWLVYDSGDDFKLMHYSDCVWYTMEQEWTLLKEALLIGSEGLWLNVQARSEDASVIASELVSRTAACDAWTAPGIGDDVRLLPTHLVGVKFGTVPYTAIQRVYNSTLGRRADDPYQYKTHIVLHDGREFEVLVVTAEKGGASLTAKLLAALAARAPQAEVGYEKPWWLKSDVRLPVAADAPALSSASDLSSLRLGLFSPDPTIRHRCATAIGDLGAAGGDALPDLEKIRGDPSRPVSLRATWAIETIQEKLRKARRS